MKFNIDSPVFEFLGTLADFTVLNVLFLATCLPIVTIGTALSALFTVTMREARGENGSFVKPYLQAFQKNLKSSTLLFILYAAAGAILIFAASFWLHYETTASYIMLFIIVLFLFLYGISFCYVFALNARFENGLRQTVKNALLLGLSNPKYTFCLLLINAAAAGICYISPLIRVFMLIFGAAFTVYCESFLICTVFKKFED